MRPEPFQKQQARTAIAGTCIIFEEKVAAHPRPWGRDRRDASLSVARPGRGTRDRHTKLLSCVQDGLKEGHGRPQPRQPRQAQDQAQRQPYPLCNLTQATSALGYLAHFDVLCQY